MKTRTKLGHQWFCLFYAWKGHGYREGNVNGVLRHVGLVEPFVGIIYVFILSAAPLRFSCLFSCPPGSFTFVS